MKIKSFKKQTKRLFMDICNTSIKHNLTDPRKILQDISPDFLMFQAYVQIQVKHYERKLVEKQDRISLSKEYENQSYSDI